MPLVLNKISKITKWNVKNAEKERRKDSWRKRKVFFINIFLDFAYNFVKLEYSKKKKVSTHTDGCKNFHLAHLKMVITTFKFHLTITYLCYCIFTVLNGFRNKKRTCNVIFNVELPLSVNYSIKVYSFLMNKSFSWLWFIKKFVLITY